MLTEFQGMQSDMRMIATRVIETEDRISVNEDTVVSLQADNSAIKTEIAALQQKIEDLENRSRRSNI